MSGMQGSAAEQAAAKSRGQSKNPPGHAAAMIAGLVALLIVNFLGLGDALGGRAMTGFVVGGVVYFIVALIAGASNE
jgi:hypothetical protein